MTQIIVEIEIKKQLLLIWPAKSQTRYIFIYAGCPLTSSSKMQTETVLTTTLSEGLQRTIPIMNLVEDACWVSGGKM